MKDFRVTKNVKEIKFEGVLGELEKKLFSDAITYKISESNSRFHVK